MSNNLTPHNNRGLAHGLIILHFTNGKLMSKYYLNGNLIGYAEWYSGDTNNLITSKQFFLK